MTPLSFSFLCHPVLLASRNFIGGPTLPLPAGVFIREGESLIIRVPHRQFFLSVAVPGASEFSITAMMSRPPYPARKWTASGSYG